MKKLMLAVSLGLLTAAYALETEQFVYAVENGEARLTGLTVAGQAAEMLSIPEKTVDGIPSDPDRLQCGARRAVLRHYDSEFREIYRKLCLL